MKQVTEVPASSSTARCATLAGESVLWRGRVIQRGVSQAMRAFWAVS